MNQILQLKFNVKEKNTQDELQNMYHILQNSVANAAELSNQIYKPSRSFFLDNFPDYCECPFLLCFSVFFFTLQQLLNNAFLFILFVRIILNRRNIKDYNMILLLHN